MLQARPLHFLALSRKNPTLASIESKHSFLKNLRRLPEVYTYVLHGLIYLHHDLGWVLMKSMQFHEQNLNIVFMLCRNIMIVHNGRVTILSISKGGKGHVKFLPFPSSSPLPRSPHVFHTPLSSKLWTMACLSLHTFSFFKRSMHCLEVMVLKTM